MVEERAGRFTHEREVFTPGKALYLTADPELIRAQIDGVLLISPQKAELLDRISTDEIIPSRAAMSSSDPENLGDHLLTGLRGSIIEPGEIKGRFQTIVAGKSFGRGSSREHAQLALKGAGINLVVAESFEEIFEGNCRNYGIPNMTLDNPHAAQVLSGRKTPKEYLNEHLSSIDKEVQSYGGFMPYTRARLEGRARIPEYTCSPRPMTVVEKIIAQHTRQQVNGHFSVGVPYVKPGDQLFVGIDSGYAYELQTDIAQQSLVGEFGSEAPVRPDKFSLFEDHLAHMGDHPIRILHQDTQREFAQKYGIAEYRVDSNGVRGICHTVMLEEHVLPGHISLGNDSHTPTLGAANAFAIPKGATDFAAALLTEDVLVTVPETIHFNLKGKLREGVVSKDLMLHILSMPEMQDRDKLIASHRVLQFGGRALEEMPFDDQIVLTNMSPEGQAFSGVIEPNRKLRQYMAKQHSLSVEDVELMFIYPDADAQYAHELSINLSEIEPMISLPGDTQNGIPLSQLDSPVRVDFAYIGSCTGGKLKDLIEVAQVLDGRKVADGVDFKIQASSQSVQEKAEKLGLLRVFREAGAQVIKTGCGDCMGATPDANDQEQVVISDTNRNFPGRMGKKRQVYLSNPKVVAASAVKGEIVSPTALK